MKANKCPSCGAAVLLSSNKCNYCGTQFEDEQVQDQIILREVISDMGIFHENNLYVKGDMNVINGNNIYIEGDLNYVKGINVNLVAGDMNKIVNKNTEHITQNSIKESPKNNTSPQSHEKLHKHWKVIGSLGLKNSNTNSNKNKLSNDNIIIQYFVILILLFLFLTFLKS